MAANKINRLKAIGTIKEEPIEKEFYSQRDKGYFKANTYPLSVLTYDVIKLNEAYEKSYGGDTHELRIETKNKEEVLKLISILEKVFKIEKAPATYEHRNHEGYYSYFKIKTLNYSKEEENRFLVEIRELKNKNEEIKKEYQGRIDKILNVLKTYLGEDLNFFSLECKLDELVNRVGIPETKNSRKAGRKPKFNKEQITGMQIMKENGYSYNKIAEEYKTTKVTVIKYLKK
jgi:hypothetical protein